MREANLKTEGIKYPKTKHYYQKVFFIKVFGKRFYKFFKVFKIILLCKSGRSFEISEFLKKIIKKDFVIFDIGANLGQYAVRLAPLLKESGMMICAEPVYEDYLYMEKIKNFLNLKNLVCRNYAISNYEGESSLYIPVIDNDIELDTRATIDLENYYFNYQNYRTQEVNVITLETLFKETGLSRLDIIKSDTEGNDNKVILGSVDLIKRFFPMIMVEDSHEEAWLKVIYDIGYKPFYVKGDVNLIDAFKITRNEKDVKYDLLVLIHGTKLPDYSKYLINL